MRGGCRMDYRKALPAILLGALQGHRFRCLGNRRLSHRGRGRASSGRPVRVRLSCPTRHELPQCRGHPPAAQHHNQFARPRPRRKSAVAARRRPRRNSPSRFPRCPDGSSSLARDRIRQSRSRVASRVQVPPMNGTRRRPAETSVAGFASPVAVPADARHPHPKLERGPHPH